MREIKFRACEKCDKSMHDVIQMSIGDWIAVPLQVDEDEWELRQIAWDDIELREFTGLKDKNGVEIYEGDVVKTETGYIYQAMFKLFSVGVSGAYGYNVYDNCEVIGNIYQNPELLN